MEPQTFHSTLSHLDATGLIDTLPQPILILDSEVCVAFANRAARALLGLSLRELQGQPLDLLFQDGQALRATFTRQWAEALVRVRPPRLTVRELARPERELALKLQAFEAESTGPHLLVQLSRVRARRGRAMITRLPVGAADRPVERPQLECA